MHLEWIDFPDNVKEIAYSFHSTPWGKIAIASIHGAVCLLTFSNNKEALEKEIRSRLGEFTLYETRAILHQTLLNAFITPTDTLFTITVKGSAQEKTVWKLLTEVKRGETASYKWIALQMGNSNLVRVIGHWVGKNPISLIIPCHRIIKSDGSIGGYHWGVSIKQDLLEWEQNNIK